MIYGNKHVVFEQVGVDDTTYTWNASNNLDDDNCYNNYDISNIRTTLSSTILPKLSNDLTGQLVSTTIQTAKNGTSSTLVSTSDKLFLPAGKEISASPTDCVSQEIIALTTWQYWITHTTNSYRLKYDSTSTARSYWLRSPYSGNSSHTIYIDGTGNFTNTNAYAGRRVASCFAW